MAPRRSLSRLMTPESWDSGPSRRRAPAVRVVRCRPLVDRCSGQSGASCLRYLMTGRKSTHLDRSLTSWVLVWECMAFEASPSWVVTKSKITSGASSRRRAVSNKLGLSSSKVLTVPESLTWPSGWPAEATRWARQSCSARIRALDARDPLVPLLSSLLGCEGLDRPSTQAKIRKSLGVLGECDDTEVETLMTVLGPFPGETYSAELMDERNEVRFTVVRRILHRFSLLRPLVIVWTMHTTVHAIRFAETLMSPRHLGIRCWSWLSTRSPCRMIFEIGSRLQGASARDPSRSDHSSRSIGRHS